MIIIVMSPQLEEVALLQKNWKDGCGGHLPVAIVTQY